MRWRAAVWICRIRTDQAAQRRPLPHFDRDVVDQGDRAVDPRRVAQLAWDIVEEVINSEIANIDEGMDGNQQPVLVARRAALRNNRPG
nr:hypothetical protein [Mesorhizobium albiziae]